ncbi:MAG: hypothetical protein MUP08_00840 [Desulfobulbaceae bacterium]|nr:hypothetical protein [Desulfobulbaceae bacterium]
MFNEGFGSSMLSLSLTLNVEPSYLTPQDRVTFVIKLAALAARGGAEPVNGYKYLYVVFFLAAI